MKKRSIPEVREELAEAAKRLRRFASLMRGFGLTNLATDVDGEAANLGVLIGDMHRTMTKQRTHIKSDPLTPRLAGAIRAFHARNPGASSQEIANRFKVNPGRVAEAIAGTK